MSIFSNFENSISASRSLTDMYRELREKRSLGLRGRLTSANEDLLWLPRSAVVVAMSALDAYVHEVLYNRIPRVLRRKAIPESLCEKMAELVPIRNAASFKDAFSIMSGGNASSDLADEFREKTLSFLSYQSPDKIISAYALLGYPDVFDDVSAIWQGPSTSPDDIKRELANYTRRRNQIAHEGDREGREVRHMPPWYADRCSKFIEGLVTRLHRTVYPKSGV